MVLEMVFPFFPAKGTVSTEGSNRHHGHNMVLEMVYRAENLSTAETPPGPISGPGRAQLGRETAENL